MSNDVEIILNGSRSPALRPKAIDVETGSFSEIDEGLEKFLLLSGTKLKQGIMDAIDNKGVADSLELSQRDSIVQELGSSLLAYFEEDKTYYEGQTTEKEVLFNAMDTIKIDGVAHISSRNKDELKEDLSLTVSENLYMLEQVKYDISVTQFVNFKSSNRQVPQEKMLRSKTWGTIISDYLE